MTDVESRAAPTVPQWSSAFERVLFGLGAVVCLGLFAFKFVLVDRINVNWDEFLYLSNVHALARGELSLLLQGAYAHLFQWLTSAAVDEIGQIVRARLVMVILLGATAVLIWFLSRHWLGGFPSIVPPLAYLSSLPVMQHGGAFRADSLVAPLMVAGILLLVRSRHARWRDWSAGVLLGVALAVTIKSVLLLPVFVAILAFRESPGAVEHRDRFREAAMANARFLSGCAVAALVLLTLHRLSISATPVETIASYGGRVAGKVLVDVPFFSQGRQLQRFFYWQPLPWMLIALGFITAIFKRRLQLAALGLALLPIAFYRNAFSYFYVVMLAPAVPLAGYAVQELRAFLRCRSSPYLVAALLVAIAAGLFYQAAAPVRHVREDDQAQQRALVSAVHRIFPEPVAYVDRCGMMSSFRKANFFMSTWGLEQYRARHVPFMRKALREHQPAFVLVNSPYLDPETGGPYALLPEDRELIRNFYPPFWGPVRVAGAEGRFDDHDAVALTVPFAGTYRLVTAVPVTIDGNRYASGDLVSVASGRLTVNMAAGGDSGRRGKVALFIASAGPAPDFGLPDSPIFAPL